MARPSPLAAATKPSEEPRYASHVFLGGLRWKQLQEGLEPRDVAEVAKVPFAFQPGQFPPQEGQAEQPRATWEVSSAKLRILCRRAGSADLVCACASKRFIWCLRPLPS